MRGTREGRIGGWGKSGVGRGGKEGGRRGKRGAIACTTRSTCNHSGRTTSCTGAPEGSLAPSTSSGGKADLYAGRSSKRRKRA